jgi:hypothetical protein
MEHFGKLECSREKFMTKIGLSRFAYVGKPRKLSTQWPEAMTLPVGQHDWAYSLQSKEQLRCQRDALAVLSALRAAVSR